MSAKINNLIKLVQKAKSIIEFTKIGKFFNHVDVIGDDSDFIVLHGSDPDKVKRISNSPICVECPPYCFEIQIEDLSSNCIIKYGPRILGIKIKDLNKIMNKDFKYFESEVLKWTTPNRWRDYGIPEKDS